MHLATSPPSQGRRLEVPTHLQGGQRQAWWGAGRPLCQERSGNRLQECFVAAGRYVLICLSLFVLSGKKMSIDHNPIQIFRYQTCDDKVHL